ncbi:phosphatase PAP2 family protein [Halocatena pleomorpha]|uniref:Inositol phosphorylceramide synthase n=1 Tax=Halocatena pleomorpha TaxID=1785090 RepID=A0A3P3R517_9EURY|nr:phosphatase PAP2 family protein [Halocatena pleomorpha]RRJ27683.1 inositol phosphorylceramide synthase [Halocatena pleomorpha]
MNLMEIFSEVVVVVSVLLPMALLFVVGPSRLWTALSDLRPKLKEAAPGFMALGIVLGINSIARDTGNNLSWIVGVNITGFIHRLEGQFVANLQSMATPTLTSYFSAIYVFGYTFLLVFPLFAYLLHDDTQPLYETVAAYIINYSVGLVCYIAFVAYGPRNLIPELVKPLLYINWPHSQLLTSEVNTNTNVFPSLHTSMSVTVALLSYRFRDIYRRWVPIAWMLAISVAISTMYLGIHWLTDVVVGTVLAVISVVLAARFGDRLRRGMNRVTNDWIGDRAVAYVRRWLQND